MQIELTPLIITILKEVQNTPFPFLLAIVGIIFLIIAITGRVGQISISGIRQFWFGFSGSIFYILSIVSYVIPAFSSLSFHSFTSAVNGLQSTLVPFILFTGVALFSFLGFAGYHGPDRISGKRQAWSIMIGIFLIFALLFIFGEPVIYITQNETLTVPFIQGTKGIQTQQVYKEDVTIIVSGVGQADGTNWSDAFYIYTDKFGIATKPLHPATRYNEMLWINGQPADAFLAQTVPPFRADHTYKFTINAPVGHLIFAVGDKYPKDNSGSYTITILSNG